jgi:hypothetical protein
MGGEMAELVTAVCEHCRNEFRYTRTRFPRRFCGPKCITGNRVAHAAERRKASRRRPMVDPTTCERHYSDDDLQFMKAMDRYKREAGRPYPTLSEVWEVVRSLGYRKVADPGPLPGAKG